MIKKIILLLLVATSSKVVANPIDKYIADKIKWENTKAATVLSDVGMGTMLVAPYLMALRDKENRKGRVTTAAVMHLLNFSMVDMVKMRTKRLRPNGRSNRSFYSGHTSTAFTSAGLLCLQDSKSVCAAGIVTAASVGYFRMAGHWHWASDVMVGMGIGFMNGKYVPNLVVRF